MAAGSKLTEASLLVLLLQESTQTDAQTPDRRFKPSAMDGLRKDKTGSRRVRKKLATVRQNVGVVLRPRVNL